MHYPAFVEVNLLACSIRSIKFVETLDRLTALRGTLCVVTESHQEHWCCCCRVLVVRRLSPGVVCCAPLPILQLLLTRTHIYLASHPDLRCFTICYMREELVVLLVVKVQKVCTGQYKY